MSAAGIAVQSADCVPIARAFCGNGNSAEHRNRAGERAGIHEPNGGGGAGAALVVVPLAVGQMHLGGQQTYQNAMAMGKPVIVADDCGADEYVTNGVDGILLSPGDMEGMRAAIVQVMSDPAYAKRLGENGKRAMQDPRYEPEYFLTKLLEAVRESVAERQGAAR